jgi:hypothetical protein
MLKKDELYSNEINAIKANSIYSDENQVKLLLIFTLLFIILTVGYLMYYSTKENGSTIKGTKVLGVSYIPDEQNRQGELTEENRIQYNSKLNTSTVEDKGEYKDVVMVDDKDEYRDATVVDDKKEYTHVVTVKESI